MRAGAERELVLVGGGHAHVQVIRGWIMRPLAGVRLSVVLDRAEAVYSGMVPGFVAGDYTAGELEIDVVPLAGRAGARVILARATRVDPGQRRIELEGRAPLRYDAASLDVGSSVRGLDLPGVREHALATRPIRAFVDGLSARLAALRRAPDAPPPRLAVVGAGAAGVELACTLRARLRGQAPGAQIVLVGDAPEILPGQPARVAARARREAERRGILVRCGARVVGVAADALRLEGGEALACDLVVWATGAAGAQLVLDSRLPRSADGFVRVSACLEVEGCEGLFAAGDCASLCGFEDLPKAGVYAVREGPVLAANLRARLAGGRLRPYRPQRDFLALLNLGEREALGMKWGRALAGRSVWRVKDRIDRRFVERFQVLTQDGGRPGLAAPGMGAAEMACGGCAAKLGADALAGALARVPAAPADASVLVGLARPDDTAVLRLPGGALALATLDAFRAFSGDAWLVGRVAAVNAVSDVFAKGGRPRHALALVTVPEAEPARAEETLFQVLAGVRAALDPLGVSLVGGHTTAGDELFVGLSILGELVAGEELLGQAGLRPGDVLVLSKPLGTGVLLAADMRGLARGAWIAATHASMLRANGAAARVAREAGARACTDVSGFGLAGHLAPLLRASGVSAQLRLAALPALPGAEDLLARGLRSTYHEQNARGRSSLAAPPALAASPRLELLFDPQTSGGLLFGVPAGGAEAALAALRAAGDGGAAAIGEVAAARPDGVLLALA